jgi:hypothetical protein
MVAFPQPIGPGFSAADVPVSPATSRTFTMPSGNSLIVTFNPISVSDPGVVTLYNASDVAVLEMAQGGSYGFSSPGGDGFYFKATKGARNVSVVEPTIVY